MFVYLIIFVALVMLGIRLPDRSAGRLLPWVGVFLLWFMGTRYYVGCDFSGYLSRFNNIFPDEDFWGQVFQVEAGFQFLILSVKGADLSYMWLNVFASAIFLTCVAIFCRAHRRPLMVLALLFPIIIIQLGMSGLRQALATAFLMLATVAFVRHKRFLTGLLVVLGGAFHISVVIFLPMALLPGRKISIKKLIFSVIVLAPVAYLVLQSRVDVYVDRYIDEIYGESNSGGALIRYALPFISAIGFLRYHKKLERMFPEIYNLLLLFSIITFAILPLVFISTVALHRINYYIMPVSILTIIYLSLVLSPKYIISFIRFIPPLLYGIYSLVWFVTSKHAQICYVPYRSYSFIGL